MQENIEQAAEVYPVEPADRCPTCGKVFKRQFASQQICPGHIRTFQEE